MVQKTVLQWSFKTASLSRYDPVSLPHQEAGWFLHARVAVKSSYEL